MTCVEIPGTLLQSFFEQATTALDALDLSSHDSSGTGTEGPDTILVIQTRNAKMRHGTVNLAHVH